MQQKQMWLAVLAGLLLAWGVSVGLFLAGVLAYPWGWLLLLVLSGWAWYKYRESP